MPLASLKDRPKLRVIIVAKATHPGDFSVMFQEGLLLTAESIDKKDKKTPLNIQKQTFSAMRRRRCLH